MHSFQLRDGAATIVKRPEAACVADKEYGACDGVDAEELRTTYHRIPSNALQSPDNDPAAVPVLVAAVDVAHPQDVRRH